MGSRAGTETTRESGRNILTSTGEATTPPTVGSRLGRAGETIPFTTRTRRSKNNLGDFLMDINKHVNLLFVKSKCKYSEPVLSYVNFPVGRALISGLKRRLIQFFKILYSAYKMNFVNIKKQIKFIC